MIQNYWLLLLVSQIDSQLCVRLAALFPLTHRQSERHSAFHHLLRLVLEAEVASTASMWLLVRLFVNLVVLQEVKACSIFSLSQLLLSSLAVKVSIVTTGLLTPHPDLVLVVCINLLQLVFIICLRLLKLCNMRVIIVGGFLWFTLYLYSSGWCRVCWIPCLFNNCKVSILAIVHLLYLRCLLLEKLGFTRGSHFTF